MKFKPLPRVYPDMPLWGAGAKLYSFVISYEDGDGYRASAKVRGALPFDKSRVDIAGAFHTFADAAAACEQFAKENGGE